MGWKLAVLLLAVLVKDAHAVCNCYQAGNYTGATAPISNSYNTTDFSACFSSACSYVAYSGDDTKGWTYFTFNWAAPLAGAGGLLQIFDGTPDLSSTLPPALIQINEGENVDSSSPKYMIKSTSPRITIKYSQSSTTSANVYYGSIKAVPGLQPTAGPTSTTAMPTTRTFNHPEYNHDLALITHDILVVVNQKTSGGITALTQLDTIATNFVRLLDVTTDINSAGSSRLALATLTPYQPYYAIRGEIWGMDATDVTNNLPLSGVSIEGKIDSALTGLVNLSFNVSTNTSTDSRRNVQRSVILLTAEWPSANANLAADIQSAFDAKGVNLLVVGFNLTTVEWNQLSGGDNRWYNVLNAVGSNDTAVAQFVNPFYFNDKSSPNTWCPQFPVTNSPDESYMYFQEPFNYNGPSNTTNDKWKDPFDGQSTRYCNFANNQYTYTNPNGNGLQVKVFYELEAGKDFLKFYDSSNNLIASFTGFEVTGSIFSTTSSTITARFTSDNQSVFRGFYVQITPQ
ncbi:hypothetical protein GCK72_026208 [Caenorhabditis remanei]|uniref:CUB domain-containing protein n=1 Tax=Caenorhabditis remanei TaxID=31234 RepID=A0A6A5G5G5_CAERE|nr:hypothetical protein GCK72_026208 [Caenorhabditis remanei]KAF1749739.1 hypothetical protein GCK72_026208 [Caenorhabditis remanei]